MDIRDYIDLNYLQQIQDLFSDATGLAAIAVDSKGNYITKGSNFTDFCMKFTRGSNEGVKRCVKCDQEGKGTYFCHAGLMDFSEELYINNEYVGKIIGGQVLPHEPDIDHFKKIAKELNISEDSYIEALKTVPVRSEKSIRSAAKLFGNFINTFLNNAYLKIHDSNVLDSLDSRIANSSKLIKQINEKSKELSQIEAKQKMLALNASIEAARAGDAGRGFSIVAKEVENLAANSGSINHTINDILSSLTKEISEMDKIKLNK